MRHLPRADPALVDQRLLVGVLAVRRQPQRPTGRNQVNEAEYRIDFTITRRREGDADFEEIGFGSSGAWSNVDQAAYALESSVQNREWETSEGMPDPDDA